MDNKSLPFPSQQIAFSFRSYHHPSLLLACFRIVGLVVVLYTFLLLPPMHALLYYNSTIIMFPAVPSLLSKKEKDADHYVPLLFSASSSPS